MKKIPVEGLQWRGPGVKKFFQKTLILVFEVIVQPPPKHPFEIGIFFPHFSSLYYTKISDLAGNFSTYAWRGRMTIYLSNICIQMTDSLLPFELLYDNDWFRISSRVLYILAFTHLHILSCSCEVLLINGQANSSRKRGEFPSKIQQFKIK